MSHILGQSSTFSNQPLTSHLQQELNQLTKDYFKAKLTETMSKAIDFINQAIKKVREDEQYSRDDYGR